MKEKRWADRRGGGVRFGRGVRVFQPSEEVTL